MEKLERFLNNYKGLVIFYIIIALLAFALTKKIEDINSQAKIITEERSYYA